MKIVLRLLLVGLVLLLLLGVYFAAPMLFTRNNRTPRLFEFFDSPAEHADWMVRAGERCTLPDGSQAPFSIPTDSYIGFVWGDSFRIGHSHQGIDMFGGKNPGETPIYAAYPGYLTRLADWKSTVIVRIPDDPLQPERQIWVYYTHMADSQGNSFISEQFPPGTSEVYIETGTFLGYQGNYSGSSLNPTGVHLHLSIVLGQAASEEHPLGWFRNELDKRNTLDPSPYFGLALNATQNRDEVPLCR